MNKSSFEGKPDSLSNTRTSTYSPLQRETIRSKLSKTLGPEFISQRAGPGGRKLAYISGEKCINIANYVFGFDGWSSVIRNIQTDFVEESSGKVSVGLSVILRVILKDGTFREDIGYGEAENVRGKGPAFARAKKAGQTDALKRCLRNFGEIFNCLSDDTYVKKVLRVKARDKPLNEGNLLRSIDYEPESAPSAPPAPRVSAQPGPAHPPSGLIKTETPNNTVLEIEDEYGGDEFDDLEFFVEDQDLEGFLDEDSLLTNNSASNEVSALEAKVKTEADKADQNLQTNTRPKYENKDRTTSTTEQRSCAQIRDNTTMAPPRQRSSFQPLQQQPQTAMMSVTTSTRSNQTANAHSMPSQIQEAWDRDITSRQEQGNSGPHHGHQTPALHSPSNQPNLAATFYSARAELSDINRSEKPVFNPHLQSPSIPRSAGVDHTKSSPIPKGKFALTSDASHNNTTSISRPSFNGPGNITPRPVGIPSQLSPGNRGYKPPTMTTPAQPTGQSNAKYLPQKRALESPAIGNVNSRNALAEASKMELNLRDNNNNQKQAMNYELKDQSLANKKQRT